MRLIGLTGYARAGKDSVGDILVRVFGFKRIALADKLREAALRLDPIIPVEVIEVDKGVLEGGDAPLKATFRLKRLSEALKELGGWEVAKLNPEVRRTLQRMGTEVGRQVLGEDVWIRAALDNLPEDGSYVVTDVRFLNEAAHIQTLGGQVWRVTRPDVGPLNDHPSEREQEGIEVDRTIENTGTLVDLPDIVAVALREATLV